jgi:hypothetical protein
MKLRVPISDERKADVARNCERSDRDRVLAVYLLLEPECVEFVSSEEIAGWLDWPLERVRRAIREVERILPAEEAQR